MRALRGRGAGIAVHLRFGLVLSAVVVCIDQAVKTLMLAALPQPGSGWAVTGFFNLVHVRNHGVGFGMMSGIEPWALIVFSLSVVCILVVWMGRAHDRFTAAALGLTVGGAVGNVADRALSGAVFDFLDFHAFGYHWPAFNVADSAIVLGVAGLLVGSARESRRPAVDKDTQL